MKILVLLDNNADLDFLDHPERIGLLDEPSVRRDMARLFPHLDRARVQCEFKPLNVRMGFDPRLVRQLSDYVKAQDIELVHALTPRTMIYAALVRGLTNVPTLGSLYRIPESFTYKAVQYLWQWIIRWGIERIIVPSQIMRKSLWQINYPEQRIEVIYPGVDIETPNKPDRDELGLPANVPLVTMIAPIVPEQGVDTLLEAVPRILQRVPEAHIAVLGSGSLVRELHIKSRLMPVHWLGDAENVHDIIATSDVIVVHPRRDALPMAVLQAAGMGKPVVGTHVSGIGDIIQHSRNGLLVTYDDSRDLAIQISRLLTQANFAQNVGSTAQNEAKERFSIEVQCQQLMEMYEATVYANR